MSMKLVTPRTIPGHIQSLQSKLTELDQITSSAAVQTNSALTLLEDIDEDGLYRFKQEYLKLLAVLHRTVLNASKLQEKYEIALDELQIVDAQSIDVSKLSNDQATLKTLKAQISRAEVLLLASNKREEATRNEIRQLKFDIANLNTTIKQGVGLSAAQERTINELIQTKEQSSKELEAELDKIVSLRNGLTQISERMEQAESERTQLEKDILALREKNTAKKIEIDTELKNKEKLERDLRELRVVVTIKSQEAVAKQGSVNKATEDIAHIEAQIRNQKAMMEKLVKDQESLGTRTVKLQQDYDEQMELTKSLVTENQMLLSELKIKERELASHRSEVVKVNRIKEVLLNKSRILEDLKLQAENERRVHRETNESLMKEIEKCQRSVEGVKKVIDNLNREKDILTTSLKKTTLESNKIHTVLLLLKQQQATTELETARLHREEYENSKILRSIQAEYDRHVTELDNLQNQIAFALGEQRDKLLQIQELKKQTNNSENRLKIQTNLYEQVSSDRKLHAVQLLEAQAQIANLKRQLKILNFQISGFKDDLQSKSGQLQKHTELLLKLKKDATLIQDEIQNLKNQNEVAGAYIKTQMVEEYKLDTFVKEAEVEIARQQAQLEIIIGERDSLVHQLLTRDNELRTVYDSIKTQNLEIQRGESYYAQELFKISNLKQEILEMRKQVFDIQHVTSRMADQKHVIVKLESQIRNSQTRIKALEEDLRNPINVHRWRHLESSNPQKFQLLKLLHSLQKQLLQKSKVEIERTESISQMENLYLVLKTLVAKQAGPEHLETIKEYRNVYKSKVSMMKHMDTELNMYKAQIDEYRYEIGKLDEELKMIKAKFIAAYRKRVEGKSVSFMDQGVPPLPEKELKSFSEHGSTSGEQDSAPPDSVVDSNHRNDSPAQSETDNVHENEEEEVIEDENSDPNNMDRDLEGSDPEQ